jgi:thioester reductase-like protein
MRILLTGATGFLGMEVLARLVEREDVEVLALIRARDPGHARMRLDEVLARLYEDPRGHGRQVLAIAGDLAAEELALRRADRRLLRDTTDAVIHCAASISFDQQEEAAMNINAAGTARVAALAQSMPRLRRFLHVSTAYVAGRTRGSFGEDDLGADLASREFRNSYERSKFTAERTLADLGDALPTLTIRPSIVVGDRRSGWTPSFNVIYWPLRAFARGLIHDLPVDPDGIVDIVSVDYVADALVHLLDDEDAPVQRPLHLVAGARALSNAELIKLACKWCRRAPPQLDAYAAMPPEANVYLPYFDVRTSFTDARARAVLGPHDINAGALPDFFGVLMDYAERARWGKRAITREAASLAVA